MKSCRSPSKCRRTREMTPRIHCGASASARPGPPPGARRERVISSVGPRELEAGESVPVPRDAAGPERRLERTKATGLRTWTHPGRVVGLEVGDFTADDERGRTRECFESEPEQEPSSPTMPVAAQATASDCGEIILPMTPPLVFEAQRRGGVDPELLRGRLLRAAEEDVARGVGAREEHADPPEDTPARRTGKASAGPRAADAEAGGHARCVHDVGEGEDAGHREGRIAHVVERPAEHPRRVSPAPRPQTRAENRAAMKTADPPLAR